MSKQQQAAEEKWKEDVGRKGELIRKVFNTPNGKKLFKELEFTFSHQSCFDPCPYRTSYKLGQQELIGYIRQLKEHTPNE